MTSDDSAPHDAVPQAGTVPFRLRDGHLELCLVTSRRTGQWGFPKGVVDPGETDRTTARRETWEEAGLRGELISPLCSYTDVRAPGRARIVRMYLMRVDEVADEWEERGQRQRVWMDLEEARRRIDRPELLPVLEDAHAKIQRLEDPR